MPKKENLKAVIKRKKKTIVHDDRQGGKNYLFIIAINDYRNYPKLYNAVEDAKAIEQVLEERYVFDELLTLHDAEASRDNILEYLELLENKLTAKDNLFIFYSGHGYAQKKIGYIIPQDAPANTKRGFIPNSTLLNHLQTIEAHHILLVLDSCFSGSLLVGKDIQIQSVADRVDKIPSRYAISAGNIELVSDGIAGNHSPFANAVINFLKNNQLDRVPVSHLFLEVRKLTTYNAKQTPLGGPLFGMNNQGGEFVFRLREVDELAMWAEFSKPTMVPQIQAYIAQNPNGPHNESGLWKIALILQKEWAYDDYLKMYPNGKYAAEALKGLEGIEVENTLWQKTEARNTLAAYRTYLQQYPNGEYAWNAKAQIAVFREESVPPPMSLGSSSMRHNLLWKANRKDYIPDIPSPNLNLKSTADPNTFTDLRDGQVYKTVKLKDGNIWLAQNLNFDVGEGCWFYDDDPKNGEKYGRLYTWEAAIKACPEGWHLPSDDEWSNLKKVYEGKKAAYKSLINGGNIGFSALLGGYRNFDGDFNYLGYFGSYWCSSERSSSSALYYGFNSISKYLYRNGSYKSMGFSCRCLKD